MSTVDVSELLREAPLRMIGARIQRARKAQGLSLDGLAEAAGTSRQHIINLEKSRNRPRVPMLTRIAEATGKPVEYFLVEEAGEPNPFPDTEAA